MKNTKIVIDVNQIKTRNAFHFNIQRKYRTGVVENKKAYNRKRLPKLSW